MQPKLACEGAVDTDKSRTDEAEELWGQVDTCYM